MSAIDTQLVPATLPSGTKVGFLKGTWEGAANAVVGPAGLVTVAGSVDAYTFAPVTASNPLPARPPAPSTPAVTSVSDLNTNQTLLASNPNRLGFVIFNDSLADLFLKYGATASATSFTHKLGPGEVIERMPCYTGQIDGIWSADSTGAARITELTA